MATTPRAAASGRAAALLWSVSRARPLLSGVLRTVRQIVGAPDYERYLEHEAACHPGQPPLSPREYYADFVTRRFGGGSGGGTPTRCC